MVNVHVADWYATLSILAGVDPTDDPPVAPLPVDPSNPGMNIYGNNSVRHRLVQNATAPSHDASIRNMPLFLVCIGVDPPLIVPCCSAIRLAVPTGGCQGCVGCTDGSCLCWLQPHRCSACVNCDIARSTAEGRHEAAHRTATL